MGSKKSTAAWPVLSLFATMALLIVAYVHGASDWVYFVIFGGWWVGFVLWGQYFYRA
jgi:hypothetical protein